ncbi:MAG: L,D-transpeptidase, partial [Nitratireductor sp.]
MFSRRSFLLGACAGLFVPVAASAHPTARNPALESRFTPQTVAFSGYEPGTIVVDPRNYFLYLQLPGGRARRYGVGVGRAGLAFRGEATIGRKAEWPR